MAVAAAAQKMSNQNEARPTDRRPWRCHTVGRSSAEPPPKDLKMRRVSFQAILRPAGASRDGRFEVGDFAKPIKEAARAEFNLSRKCTGVAFFTGFVSAAGYPLRSLAT